MTYGFIQDVPANEDIYREIRSALGAEAPAGLVAHLVLAREEGGLRYVDVWESQPAWERFRRDRLEPIVTDVLARHGVPLDRSVVQFQPVDGGDAWLPTAAMTAG